MTHNRNEGHKMKWKIVDKTYICYGDKHIYAFNKETKPFLLIETINIYPTESIRLTLRVKNLSTAKKIVKLLEE